MTDLNNHYDAIFIGSGIGPMTAASLLARRKGWRCLILERHYRPGGFTHAFERKKWRWDVGVHYIGGMVHGDVLYQLLNYLSDGALQWTKMPSDFDVFEYPDLVFRVPDEEGLYRDRLKDLFPSECRGIDRYFEDMKRAISFMPAYMMSRLLAGPFAAVAAGVERVKSRLALQTTTEYMNRNFRDERLRGLLVSHWGDYGLPPGRSSFLIHSIITTHYLRGGFYPVGGGTALYEGIAPSIKRNGGNVVVNHEVQEILIDKKGRVRGVQALYRQGRHEEQRIFEAPVVVSGAGAANTYLKLLRNPPPFASELRSLGHSGSAVTLYLGFKESPLRLGLCGENRWMSNGYDHDRIYAASDLSAGRIEQAFLSFPSLKDPHAEEHTGEIISFAEYSPFQEYSALPWKKRGIKYEEMKSRMAAAMLTFVERWHPGLRDLVEFSEVSTPLSVEHFTGFRDGAIYGLPASPERYRKRWLRPQTPVPGLYLTGADVSSLGIGGALMGGVFTTSSILGAASFPGIIKEALRS